MKKKLVQVISHHLQHTCTQNFNPAGSSTINSGKLIPGLEFGMKKFL